MNCVRGFFVPLCLTFFLGLTLTSHASEPGSEAGLVLRWADILQAVDHHPLLGEAGAALEGARARLAEERELPNPELAARAGSADPREPQEGRTAWDIELTLPLDWLATRSPRIAGAREEIEVAEAEREALRREVLLQLRSRFWQVAADQALLAELRNTEEQAAQLVRLVSLRVDKGEARPIEKPRIEIEWARLRNDIARLEAEAAAHRDQLALWLTRPLGKSWGVEADLTRAPALPSLEQALATVAASHPQLQAALARLRAAREEVRTERSRRAPFLETGIFRESSLDGDVSGLTLTATIPLWNHRRGALARARADQSVRERQAEVQLLDLKAATIEAHALCRAGGDTALLFKNEVLPRAENSAHTLERTFQLGETSLLEVLDARRTLLAVRQDYQRALVEWHLDCSRLAALTGELDHEN